MERSLRNLARAFVPARHSYRFASLTPNACPFTKRQRSQIAPAAELSEETFTSAKPYSEVPGPWPAPLIGNTWRLIPVVGQFDISELAKVSKLFYEKYGRIVRLGGLVGRPDLLFVFDADEIERMYRREGPTPFRPSMPCLVKYKSEVRKDFFGELPGVVGVSQMKEKYWSRRLDARLVKYVERRRSVWDPTHSHYTSIARRQQVYEEFASKYGSNFSAESVKERWVNIRSTFSCCLRKVEASRLSTPDKPYEPRWHLWNACQFLMRVKRSGNEPSTSEDPVKIEATSDIDENSTALLLKADDEAADVEQSDGTSEHNDSLSCDNVVRGIVSALSGVQNGFFGQQKPEFAKVGRLVARKLSKMNSYEAAATSQKIMEILLLYDENNPNNPNNTSDVKSLIEEL